MQNSSCAWYLPWSLVAHQQKLMAMQQPFVDKLSGLPAQPAHAAVAPQTLQLDMQPPQQEQQVRPKQHQPQQQWPQHLQPNAATASPVNYYQAALQHHPAAGMLPMPAYSFTQSLPGATAAQLAQQSHQHQHVQPQPQQVMTQLQGHTQMHLLHSSMLPPFSLGAYLTPAPCAPAAFGGVKAQQPLLEAAPSAPSLPAPASATAVVTRPAADTIKQPLSCLSAVAYAQELQQLQLQQPINLSLSVKALRNHGTMAHPSALKTLPSIAAFTGIGKLPSPGELEKQKNKIAEKRKTEESEQNKDLKKAKLETKALKAKRPGFTDERYLETSYYIENGLRKVYPYYFTFTTFTKGRWVGEKILDIFAKEFRAHPAEEYKRCIQAGTLTVNFEKVPVDYRLRHNDLLANIVHRHEVPVTCQPITIVHMDDDIVVVNKPASIPVHPCGRYRHNTVVFILAKEFHLKNLRTIHRLDRLTSGLLLFGRSPKKARQMEQQIRNRHVDKEYICRVEGVFPDGIIECKEPIEVVSYKIGVCKVSPKGKDCITTFQKLSQNEKTSVVLCKPLTGRMHQIRVHLQYLGYPILNDPLYNHEVFGPLKGRSGDIGGKTDDELIKDLISIHNAENWLGIDCDSDISIFKDTAKEEIEGENFNSVHNSSIPYADDDSANSRETTPTCTESPQILDITKQQEDEKWNQNESTSKVDTLQSNSSPPQITISTQTTGTESTTDTVFSSEKLTIDNHCYECKVHYRDPKPKDLIMYLHAWKYKGPGWMYETELPNWARTEWNESE